MADMADAENETPLPPDPAADEANPTPGPVANDVVDPADLPEDPANTQPGVDLTPGGNLNEEYAAAEPDERRVNTSPANTPGGDTAPFPTTGIDEKSAGKDPASVAVGDKVLYRVHPLDPPEIKNQPEVEEADLLPAKVTAVNQTTVDLEIELPGPPHFVVNKHVTFGGDSGQWRYGPESAATTAEGSPDEVHRTAYVGQGGVEKAERPDNVESGFGPSPDQPAVTS